MSYIIPRRMIVMKLGSKKSLVCPFHWSIHRRGGKWMYDEGGSVIVANVRKGARQHGRSAIVSKMLHISLFCMPPVSPEIVRRLFWWRDPHMFFLFEMRISSLFVVLLPPCVRIGNVMKGRSICLLKRPTFVSFHIVLMNRAAVVEMLLRQIQTRVWLNLLANACVQRHPGSRSIIPIKHVHLHWHRVSMVQPSINKYNRLSVEWVTRIQTVQMRTITLEWLVHLHRMRNHLDWSNVFIAWRSSVNMTSHKQVTSGMRCYQAFKFLGKLEVLYLVTYPSVSFNIVDIREALVWPDVENIDTQTKRE